MNERWDWLDAYFACPCCKAEGKVDPEKRSFLKGPTGAYGTYLVCACGHKWFVKG